MATTKNEGAKKDYEVIKSVKIDGEEHTKGDVVSLPEATGTRLTEQGFVQPYTPKEDSPKEDASKQPAAPTPASRKGKHDDGL